MPPSPTGTTVPAPALTPSGASNLFAGSAVGSTTTGGQSQTPYNPASAFSPYMSQQVETSQVQVGSTLATALGLTPGPHAIGDVMSAFNDMSSAELVQLETLLWQGGFYVDAEGNPLPTPPTFGSRDSQSFDALINAALVASQGGTSIDQAIQNNINQGVGANLRSNLPQAVTGGGNLYTIDLTNAQDVKLAATQIFQAALGRNPTDAEVQAITGSVNSQTLAQGYAKEAGKESLSKTAYQVALNQRNLTYQYQTTPKVALGQVPNGPVPDLGTWAVTELQYMKLPVTTSNVQFLLGLANAAGGGMSGMNPLGTMNALSGSKPSTGGGAPQFASWAQSFQATAQALMSGPYANMLAALQSGDATGQAGSSNVTAEVSKWTAGAASNITKQAQGQSKQAQQAVASVTNTTAPQLPAGMSQNNANILGAPAVPGQSVVPASASSVPPSDVNPGQQTSNPGDTYIQPVTEVTTNAASPEAAAYQAATTGANRPAFLGNEYLNAYSAILSMIKAGGPTSG